MFKAKKKKSEMDSDWKRASDDSNDKNLSDL